MYSRYRDFGKIAYIGTLAGGKNNRCSYPGGGETTDGDTV
jgi:hypothetical protein